MDATNVTTPAAAFINKFKRRHKKELEDVFLYGYCYWFAKILESRFGGVIYYLPIANHYITLIDGIFYDITGAVEPMEEALVWDDVARADPALYERLLRDCIRKET